MEDDGESKRLSWLVSALVHLSVILVLLSIRLAGPPPPPPEEAMPKIVKRVRLVPPPGLLPMPAARPTPPPRPANDRISIGAESDRRQDRLLLERDVEITNERVGPGQPGPLAPRPGSSTAPESTESPAARATAPVTADGDDVLSGPRRPEAPLSLPAPGPTAGGGLRRTLQDLDRRIGSAEGAIARGGGQRTGPLLFDARGADFTAWVNHWRREVYRNWNIPQPALLGLRGHVDLEFTVRRDGTVTDLKILKVSGVPAFDKAAANSILASRLLALPADYAPDTVTMQATFFYNEDPQHS